MCLFLQSGLLVGVTSVHPSFSLLVLGLKEFLVRSVSIGWSYHVCKAGYWKDVSLSKANSLQCARVQGRLMMIVTS